MRLTLTMECEWEVFSGQQKHLFLSGFGVELSEGAGGLDGVVSLAFFSHRVDGSNRH